MASNETIDLTEEKINSIDTKPSESEGVEIDSAQTANTKLECPICLLPYVQPTKMPCGHVFCYLCIKGTVYYSGRCAMCRRDIPTEAIRKPELVPVDDSSANVDLDYLNSRCWYYKGRNGWWRYDERTNEDVENAFQSGVEQAELLICGELYVLDFANLAQYKKSGNGRKRTIKKDLKSAPALGTAGIFNA